MSAPIVIWIVIQALVAGAALSKHGEPRTGTHSIWASLIGTAIEGGLLYWGGFFGGAA